MAVAQPTLGRALRIRDASWSVRTALMQFFEPKQSPNRILGMEGARGLAVVLVFFVHFDSLFSSYARWEGFRWLSGFLGIVGNAGVDLFFVISGYLIYSLLMLRTTPFLKFLKRRVLRIYPTFLAVFAIYIVLSIVLPSENKIHGTVLQKSTYVVANILLLPGIFSIVPIITVAWSLSYEFFFYTTAPLGVAVLRLRSMDRRLRVLLLLTWCTVHVMFSGPLHLPLRLSMFFWGMLLFECSSIMRRSASISSLPVNLLAMACLVGALVLKYVTFVLSEVHTVHTRIPVGLITALFLGASCGFFCLVGMFGSGLLNRWLVWDPLRWLGNASYSFYLIHGLTLKGFAILLKGVVHTQNDLIFGLLLICGFLACCFTTTILFMSVERPFSLGTQYATSEDRALQAAA